MSSCREDAGMRTLSQRGWSPGPRLSNPGERKRNAVMPIRVGSICCSLCSVSNSLSHTTLSIKWEVDFSKELCRSSLLLCRRYDSVCRCIMWLYNTVVRIVMQDKWLPSIWIVMTLSFHTTEHIYSNRLVLEANLLFVCYFYDIYWVLNM